MNEQNNVVNTTTTVEKEGSKFGWGVLGFFFPLVGLILFLVWLKDKKKAAKAAGIGALIGFILNVIVTVLAFTGVISIFTLAGEPVINVKPSSKSNTKTEEKVKEDDSKWDNVNKDDNVSCNLTATRITDSKVYGDMKSVEEKYGYSADLNSDCEKVYISDAEDKDIFIVEIKEREITYQASEKQYNYFANFNGELYQINKLDNIKQIKYLKIDKKIYIYLNYGAGMQPVVLRYDMKTLKSDDIAENFYNYKNKHELKDFPTLIRGIDFDEDGNYIIYNSIYTSSGFEGLRDDPRVKVLGEVLTNKELDMDATLAKYGVDNYAYEEAYKFNKDTQELISYEVTKTIKDFYNENHR